MSQHMMPLPPGVGREITELSARAGAGEAGGRIGAGKAGGGDAPPALAFLETLSGMLQSKAADAGLDPDALIDHARTGALASSDGKLAQSPLFAALFADDLEGTAEIDADALDGARQELSALLALIGDRLAAMDSADGLNDDRSVGDQGEDAALGQQLAALMDHLKAIESALAEKSDDATAQQHLAEIRVLMSALAESGDAANRQDRLVAEQGSLLTQIRSLQRALQQGDGAGGRTAGAITTGEDDGIAQSTRGGDSRSGKATQRPAGPWVNSEGQARMPQVLQTGQGLQGGMAAAPAATGQGPAAQALAASMSDGATAGANMAGDGTATNLGQTGTQGEFGSTMRGSALDPGQTLQHAQAANRPAPAPTPVSTPEAFSVHVQQAATQGLDRMTVQMKPAELGAVEIRLDFGQDGRVHATIIAERPETLDLLQRDARSLERALQAAGFDTDADTLEFDLGQGGRENDRDGDNIGGATLSVEAAGSDMSEIAAENVWNRPGLNGSMGLDIKV